MKQRTATTVCFLSLLLISAVLAGTQTNDAITIQLRINRNYEQESMTAWIKFESGGPTSDVKAHRTTRLGKAPGGTLVGVETVSNQPNTYRIRVDSNGDGSLDNDMAQVIQLDATVQVNVRRKWGNREEPLPYRITYSRFVNDGKARDIFYWRPQYCAEGRIRINGCESLFVVLDINGDGLFDEKDSANGTTIGLDRNGDGRIWGRGEWLMATQIVEYCGKSLLVNNLKADGTSITMVETILWVPQVGESLPSFSLKALDGKTILSEELRKKVYVLDFWASWCKPCVEKFPEVKQLAKEFGNKLEIIAINVVNSSRLHMARQIVWRYKLPWIQVMTGRGEDDPIWKMFGGMEQNRLAIPLYVIVAPDGKINYVGLGGDSLSELRARITELMRASGATSRIGSEFEEGEQ